MEDAKIAGQKFEQLVLILDTLRGKDGCPWDKEQDEHTISNYFLEEVYEALDAILSGDAPSVAEELGDVLMEVVFLARIYKEKKAFTMADVVDKINQKMIRRHPHVFGNRDVATASEVIDAWNQGKKEEKKRLSIFDGIVKLAPALHSAYQIGSRVSSCGFDWNRPLDALEKVKEEVSELEKAIKSGARGQMFQEIGDALFALVNVSRHLSLNPEIALKKANDKFMQRFESLEKELLARGKSLDQTDLDEMDAIWDELKKRET
ncbi:MAG: nucleoside triphosphate pyrophosphohydrolase [Candidatus Aminicenantes bacterium]|jgi:MazG family protein